MIVQVKRLQDDVKNLSIFFKSGNCRQRCDIRNEINTTYAPRLAGNSAKTQIGFIEL